MSIRFCPYNPPARQFPQLGSTEKLYTAIQNLGLTTNHHVSLDAGDPSVYPGSGNRIYNPAGPDYDMDGDFSFNQVSPYYSSFITDTNQLGGWAPQSSTASWAYPLHKSGGVFSWCVMIKINNLPIWFPLMGTWANTTATTGMIVTLDNGRFYNTVWRSSSNATLQMAYSHPGYQTGQWMFIAASFGDNTVSFGRLNDSYFNIDYYRTGPNGNNTPVNQNTWSQPYDTPNTNDPPGGLTVLGIPGGNNQSADVSIGYLGFWNRRVSEPEFDSIFNATRGRFGL